MRERIHILIGGPAGTGIESVTQSLAKAFTREGLHAMTASEYQNLIRGGHSSSSVHVASEEVLSHQLHYDLMLAMDRLSIELHLQEIDEGGAIIYDGERTKLEGLEIPDHVTMISVPLHRLAKEAGLSLSANVVGVGALFALMDRADVSSMQGVLSGIFEKKGAQVIEINLKALQAGVTHIQESTSHRIPYAAQGDGVDRSLLMGNDAIVLGAIRAGMRFIAAYPMTPGSTILTTAAKESRKAGITVVHAEDEISAAMMAIGSNYAGVRAATSTSGGGYALMSESMSFTGQTEIPMVYYVAQRPGPSTGLPTRTAQGDLNLALGAGQGDYVRMILACSDHEDAVMLSAQAYNLAERYQIPVVVLTEKYLADMHKSVPMDIADGIVVDRGPVLEEVDPEDAKRYRDTETGVSPRILPGTPHGMHTTTSYEHDERGKAVEEVPEVGLMMDKRWRKWELIRSELPEPLRYGEADTVLITWGTTKNPAREAQRLLSEQGIEIEILHFQYLFPLDPQVISSRLEGKRVLIIEGNQSGQLEGLLRREVGITCEHSLRNYTGRPFTGEGIFEALSSFLSPGV